MDVTPRISSDSKVIQAYKDGKFKVSGEDFSGGVMVFPTDVKPWSAAENINQLTEEDFAPILAAKDDFEVLLIGTGADFAFLDPKLKAFLQKNGITPELMNTGAACRTFNVLLSEGRKVCAAMLPA
ncbi:MAG: Mth938-like domain-containing protein [Alphaproteobacteria bacterium]|nr:Mth938-like domain-containing protein [Alphaproteobacteria bacterium]